MKHYDAIRARLYNSVWAILPAAYKQYEAILGEHAADPPDDEEVQARLDAQSYGEAVKGSPLVAIIPIHGPVMRGMGPLKSYSAIADPQDVASNVEAAASDNSVREIVLDVDSPGGAVTGVSEAAAVIRQAAKVKPVTAVATGYMASAAYWMVAGASSIVASPSSEVGSIGVMLKHTDLTKAYEAAGVTMTTLRTGPKKAIGQPHEQLTPEVRAELESQLEDFFLLFLKDVARGRGITQAQARARFGDGNIYIGSKAVSLGLADRVGTLQETIDDIANDKAPQKRGKAAMTREELEAEHPELFKSVTDEARKRGEAEAKPQGGENINTALEKKVTQLNARLEATEREARDEKRRGIAISALEAAKLPPFPAIDGMDLAASFRHRIEGLALSASSDEEAGQKVDAAVAEQKVMMGPVQPPRRDAAILPRSDNSAPVQREAKTRTVRKARASIGLE